MRDQITADQIMKEYPCRLNTNDTLEKAFFIMCDKGFRHLPVMENRALVGMISINDIHRYSNKDLAEIDASDAMSVPPRFVMEKDLLTDFIKLFTTERFHSIPVVDEQHHLKGIISTSDLIEHLYTGQH